MSERGFGMQSDMTSALTKGLVTSLLAASLCATSVKAAPSLVADLVTGEVIAQEEATRAWYPASLTKLMTAYVALKAVHEGRVTLDTPFVMSMRAAKAAPSKMGFNPGTEVTLENALKMLMVKSANDIAVMIAEGISGSVEDFAMEMNASARKLGMRKSFFVNPNGLHDPRHVSSARDMAVLARALYMQFPEVADFYGIGALKLDDKIIPTHNGLLGRYPGADGMKTGFVCASGFNVVASAQRDGRHLVVVVFGSPNAKLRTLKAADLFDKGFATWRGQRANLDNLPDMAGPAPNMREEICGKGRKNIQEDDLAVLAPQGSDKRALITGPRPLFEPVDVFVGRREGWTGPVAQARSAPSAAALAAIPAAGAIAYANASTVGATASQAIAVKSLPPKKPVTKKKVTAKKALAKKPSAAGPLKSTPVASQSKAKAQ
jgi:D-alanyl-D-alanine carboxypeptidase